MELIEGRTLSIDSLLQLDDGPPLPSGWEKCLDLKSGVLYFRNRVSGAKSYTNPVRFSLQVLEHHQPLEDGRKHSLDLELALGRRMTRTAAADHATVRRHDCPVLLGSSKRQRLVLEEKHGLDLRLRLQTPEQKNCPRPSAILSLSTTASNSSCSSSSPSSSTTQVEEVETSEGESKKRRTTSSTQVMVTVGCTKCLTYVMLSKESPCCPRYPNRAAYNGCLRGYVNPRCLVKASSIPQSQLPTLCPSSMTSAMNGRCSQQECSDKNGTTTTPTGQDYEQQE